MADGKKITYDPLVLPDSFNGYPKELFGVPGEEMKHIDHLLIPYGLIKDRAEVVAQKFWENWDGRPLLALCIMNGACRFFELFIRNLNKLNVQSKHKKHFVIKYLKMENYTGDQPTHAPIKLPESLIKSLAGKHVIAVEDIVDTGHSMVKLIESLSEHNILSFQCVSMTTKRTIRSMGYKPDYCCIEIPDRWVVGFGLDFDDEFRHYDHVYVVSQQGIKDLTKK